MTLRRKARECALQMLFQWDISKQKPARIQQTYWKSARAARSTRELADTLFEGAASQAEKNDKLIEEISKGWRLERMAVIDRNILRLAILELRTGTAPPKVAINEALELAKKFSSAEAAAFINGILDAALKTFEQERPASG